MQNAVTTRSTQTHKHTKYKYQNTLTHNGEITSLSPYRKKDPSTFTDVAMRSVSQSRCPNDRQYTARLVVATWRVFIVQFPRTLIIAHQRLDLTPSPSLMSTIWRQPDVFPRVTWSPECYFSARPCICLVVRLSQVGVVTKRLSRRSKDHENNASR